MNAVNNCITTDSKMPLNGSIKRFNRLSPLHDNGYYRVGECGFGVNKTKDVIMDKLNITTSYMKRLLLILVVITTGVVAFGQEQAPASLSTWNGDSGVNGKYPDGNPINEKFGEKSVGVYGQGTEDDPFLINNASEFAFLSHQTSNTVKKRYKDMVFKLTVDIDLDDFPWSPIGQSTNMAFAGYFKGENHTIKNLNVIDVDLSTNRGDKVGAGLFGSFSGAYGQEKQYGVENLNIDNGLVQGYKNVGGIVGVAKPSDNHPVVIKNCNNMGVKVICINPNGGVVYGKDVGGIVGLTIHNTYSPLILTGCSNFATVDGVASVGGIVGYLDDKTTIENCSNYGIVKSSEGRVGGAVGFSKGHVVGCSNSGEIDGGLKYAGTGGVVGLNNNVVSECYNTGSVAGISGVGGIVGSNMIDTGVSINPKVSDCYNAGSVTTTNKAGSNIGGIVGTNNVGSGTGGVFTLGGIIEDVYNTGSVTSDNYTIKKGEIVGNVMGYNGNINVNVSIPPEGTFVRCYYDNQFSRIVKGVGSSVDDVVCKVDGKATVALSGSGDEVRALLDGSWTFEFDSYPQLTRFLTPAINRRATYSRLYATAIFLNEGSRWDKVLSGFNVSTNNGVLWGTSNDNIVYITRDIVSLGLEGGEATLSVLFNNTRREIPIVVEIDKTPKDIHHNVVTVVGSGQVNNTGKTITTGSCIDIRHGEIGVVEISPADGYYLSELKYTTIDNVTKVEAEYDLLNSVFDGVTLEVDYANTHISLKIKTLDGFVNNKLSIIFTKINTWNGSWTAEYAKKPFQATEKGKLVDKYLVYRPCELIWLGRNIFYSENVIKSATKLANNLYMGEHEWTPSTIPESELSQFVFSGELDGNRKTISDLKITTTNRNAGLFNVMSETAYVHELGLIGVTYVRTKVDASHDKEINIGAIAGINRGRISQCYSYANLLVDGENITADINAGGLVGKNIGTVEYSYFHGTVRSETSDATNINRGGVIGKNEDGTYKEILYDRQMCSAKDAIGTGRAEGNGIAIGLSTTVLTGGMSTAKFSDFNALGAWYAQIGHYLVLLGSHNNNVVNIGSMPINLMAFMDGETPYEENGDDVKSNFSVVADYDNGIVWSAVDVNELTGEEIASTAMTITTNGKTSYVKVSRKRTDAEKEDDKKRKIVKLRASIGGEAYKEVLLIVPLTDIEHEVKIKIKKSSHTGKRQDKIKSGGEDYTEIALTEYGAVLFTEGSAGEFSIIPGEDGYMSSLELITDINDPLIVTNNVSVDYTAGELVYKFMIKPTDDIYEVEFSSVPPWNGGIDMMPHNDGTGYLIYHPEELAWLAKEVNSGTDANPKMFDGCVFKLLNNIDLNNGSHDWTSIGGYGDATKYFRGGFDGNGKVLKQITINQPNVDYVGFFGYLDQGSKVFNLTLEDSKITGRNYVGGLVGHIAMGRSAFTDINVQNCKISKSSATVVDCFIKGVDNVGGLVGYSEQGTIVQSCINENVNVSGGINIGGIIGFNDGMVYSSINKNSNIEGTNNVGGIAGYSQGLTGATIVSGCKNSKGIVTATSGRAGGIVGYNNGTINTATITDCVNSGNVFGITTVGGIVAENNRGILDRSYNFGDVAGGISSDGVGGIVGFNSEKSIELCFNTGLITGKQSVGGIVGRGTGAVSGGIKNCYNLGVITAVDGDYAGGIVGGAFGFIHNCYNAGDVKGVRFVGSIAGYPNTTNIENCFYDYQMSPPKAICGVDVEGVKGYLTREIVEEGKGFIGRNSWEYDANRQLYPKLSVLNIGDLEDAIQRPLLLYYDADTKDYQSVRRVRNDFDITGTSLTWSAGTRQPVEDDGTTGMTPADQVIAISKYGSKTTVAMVRPLPTMDTYILMTGVAGVDSEAVRKAYIKVRQDDKYRKIFTNTNGFDWFTSENWTPGEGQSEGPPTPTENCIVAEGATAIVYSDKVVECGPLNVRGKLIIEAGSSLKTPRLGNVSTDKVVLQNTLDKSASLILTDKASAAPHVTVEQAVRAITKEDYAPYNYQLVSSPVGTLVKGSTVVDVFEGVWLDRYNQYDAMWERYEKYYNGVKWFDVEEFRGYSVNFSETSPLPMTFKGQTTVDDAFYSISYNEKKLSGDKDYGGLNLIGNPYTAAMKMNWDAIIGAVKTTDIEENVWIWDSKALQYKTLPGNITDAIIPSCQGFWVRVKDSDIKDEVYFNDITMILPYDSAVVESNKPLYKSGDRDISFVKLEVNGSRYSDEVMIACTDGCTTDYESGWDGEKWAGAVVAPQLYAIEGEYKLAVNTKGDIDETVLAFEIGEDSQYVIKTIGSENVENVQLVDLKTGTTHDILSTPYTFTAIKGDEPKRFILKAKSTKGIDDVDTADWCSLFSYKNVVTVVGGEGEMEVIDMQGRVVKSVRISSDRCSLTVDRAGTYVVRVIGEMGIVSRKVVIN